MIEICFSCICNVNNTNKRKKIITMFWKNINMYFLNIIFFEKNRKIHLKNVYYLVNERHLLLLRTYFYCIIWEAMIKYTLKIKENYFKSSCVIILHTLKKYITWEHFVICVVECCFRLCEPLFRAEESAGRRWWIFSV